jgi:hypothetical protein
MVAAVVLFIIVVVVFAVLAVDTAHKNKELN